MSEPALVKATIPLYVVVSHEPLPPTEPPVAGLVVIGAGDNASTALQPLTKAIERGAPLRDFAVLWNTAAQPLSQIESRHLVLTDVMANFFYQLGRQDGQERNRTEQTNE